MTVHADTFGIMRFVGTKPLPKSGAKLSPPLPENGGRAPISGLIDRLLRWTGPPRNLTGE